MAQVKFYSVGTDATKSDANGIYFVTGGELYKGTSRFGANKVWTVPAAGQDAEGYNLASALTAAGVTGQISGDILTGYGAAKVFNGTTWVDLGQDQQALTNELKELVSGIAFDGEGSYITGITQDANTGKVTASVSNFKTDVKTAVGNGASESTSNGVTVSVTTTSGKVTSVSVSAPAAKTWTPIDVGGAGSYIQEVHQTADGQVSATAVAFPTLGTGTADGTLKLGSGADAKVSGWDTVKTDISNLQAVVSYSGTGTKTVTADTGTFTSLTVTDTATFSVTNVSASSLTVNGSTIEQLADKQIAAIAAATSTGASNGITVSVTTQGGSVTAVTVDATAFGNVMSFKGVVTALPSESNVSGDIVVIGANPTGTGLVQGQEYIYDGTKWELIGDQNTYAVNAFSSTASVYTGATTLPAAVSAAGAAIDTLTTKVSTLEGAVTGGNDDDGTAGVNVSVTTAATTAVPTVTVTVTKATLNETLGTTNVAGKTVATSIGATGVDTALATEKAVRDAITDAQLVWLDANGDAI